MRRWIALGLALLAAPLQASLILLDPTAPPSQPSAPQVAQLPGSGIEQLRVQQILVRSGFEQAVINGKALKQGDRINGFRIGRIEPQRVALERDGKQHWLDLYAGITLESVKR